MTWVLQTLTISIGVEVVPRECLCCYNLYDCYASTSIWVLWYYWLMSTIEDVLVLCEDVRDYHEDRAKHMVLLCKGMLIYYVARVQGLQYKMAYLILLDCTQRYGRLMDLYLFIHQWAVSFFLPWVTRRRVCECQGPVCFSLRDFACCCSRGTTGARHRCLFYYWGRGLTWSSQSLYLYTIPLYINGIVLWE